jgi:hypothetical protein
MNVECATLDRSPSAGPTRWVHKRITTLELMSESQLDAIAEDGWQFCGVQREGGQYVHFFMRQVSAGPQIEQRG